MDKAEALQVLREHLGRYRRRTHRELTSLIGEPETSTVRGPSGAEYQIEIEALWDDEAGSNLRVLGSIDDGGFRALVPVCDDFIVTAEGSFVGEE